LSGVIVAHPKSLIVNTNFACSNLGQYYIPRHILETASPTNWQQSFWIQIRSSLEICSSLTLPWSLLHWFPPVLLFSGHHALSTRQ